MGDVRVRVPPEILEPAGHGGPQLEGVARIHVKVQRREFLHRGVFGVGRHFHEAGVHEAVEHIHEILRGEARVLEEFLTGVAGGEIQRTKNAAFPTGELDLFHSETNSSKAWPVRQSGWM